MINKVFLTGRLTKNPEINYVRESNKYVANICIAQNHGKRDENGKQEANYLTCTIWNESIISKLRNDNFKGLQVALEGKIFNKTVKDKNNKWVTKTTILVDELDLL